MSPHQRLKRRAFRKLLTLFADEHVLHLSTDKRGNRLPERWSDGLFLGVAESSSDIAAVKLAMLPHLISHQPHPNRFLTDATSMCPDALSVC